MRDRADIVEIVSETVPLTRAGANFRGLCPFHREKTPSFFVHPTRQAFKCFGCGEGGSVFHFLMKARNLSFADSVEELAERYGVAVRYEGGAPGIKPREDLFAILRLASETYREMLRAPAGKPGRDFLRRRGVTPEAEQEFSLGWAGHGGELQAAMKRGGIDPARAEAAGLLLSSGGGFRERFRGRLLFPIADARGRVCGFGGRAVDDAVPKYLNSPESELYRKSSLLYGLHQALPSIRNEGRVVVVEGYMDLIGLWQKGIRSVVATCGTALTESHARTLKRLSGNVILFYDGDVAGKMATVRSGGPLYAAGVSPKVLFPPKGMDPDDWAKVTPMEEIARRIAGAVPLMEYIERGASRKYDLGTISGKLSYVRLMEKYLRWIGEPAERELYAQRVAATAGLPVETIRRQVGEPGAGAPPAGDAPAAAKDPLPEESRLLQLLAADPTLAVAAVRDGVAPMLSGEDAREAVFRLASLAERAPSADAAALLSETLPEGVRSRLSAEIVRSDVSPEEARRRYPGALRELRIRQAQREIDDLQERMRAAADEDERAPLFSRVLAAKMEKERLESERRSR
ncbi:MAG: DNA primase [Deltaproteobacteria bacterium]|nr:DNA primase [Deltaproteobacteria bacterium]